jgi:hypothetical protein
MMRFIMVGLAFLMISDAPYPAVPRVNLRTVRGIIGAAILLGAILGLIFLPREFFFPVLMCYVLFGVIKGFVLKVVDRVPTVDSIFDEEEDEEDEAGLHLDGGVAMPAHHGELAAGRRRRRRKKKPRNLPTPTINRAVDEGIE